MNKIITYRDLRNFTYSNDDICARPIKGIVLNFTGLGGSTMYGDHTPEGVFFARHGIIYLTPYYNPWCWMNDQTVAFVDEIVDVVLEKYSLGSATPVISTGGSMGGQCALVYTAKAKRAPTACVTNCPVCDLVFHFSERPDLPRTLYSAFYYVNGSVRDALSTASPLHLAKKMPDVNYVIYHCTNDKAVNIDLHSRKFAQKMRSLGKKVELVTVEGCSHCALPPDVRANYFDRIVCLVESK